MKLVPSAPRGPVGKTSTRFLLQYTCALISRPNLRDHRISKDGIIIIKAQQYRHQEQNKQEALERLTALIKNAGVVAKKRKPTKPSHSSKQKRMDSKTKHGRKKEMRRKVID